MNYAPSPERPLTTAHPFFPATEVSWLQSELADILSHRLAMGPRVAKFEQEFAAYCGCAHGIALPNCTAAMEIALTCLGVSPGDEILVPVQTFVATGMAVHLAGAQPIFTEISSDTFSMDFEDAWARVTDRTRGAIVVHFGGIISPRFPAFVERMRASGRFVVEDAAHAHGAELGGRRAGTLADVGCFSFYPTKIMTTGEGGMLVTDRTDIAEAARCLQNRGLGLGSPVEEYVRPGRNNRFTEIAAAIGLSQLRCLPDFLAARRAVAATYDKELDDTNFLVPLVAAPTSRPSYWRYTVLLNDPSQRVPLRAALANDGIAVDWAYDPPLHLQPVFRDLYSTAPGMLPIAEEVMSRHICLPVHARLRPDDAAFVANRLREYAGRQYQPS